MANMVEVRIMDKNCLVLANIRQNEVFKTDEINVNGPIRILITNAYEKLEKTIRDEIRESAESETRIQLLTTLMRECYSNEIQYAVDKIRNED